jgi:hypothetical protein
VTFTQIDCINARLLALTPGAFEMTATPAAIIRSNKIRVFMSFLPPALFDDWFT